ncbi:hypothetical protein HBA_0328 [Sodalis endosymbiont of Henestaris halophilus]|nr:hypothetical protein HBA_0328 [Sodalis endosymbiont of Henestaris halophilus]
MDPQIVSPKMLLKIAHADGFGMLQKRPSKYRSVASITCGSSTIVYNQFILIIAATSPTSNELIICNYCRHEVLF